jgi:hypothetical protein
MKHTRLVCWPARPLADCVGSWTLVFEGNSHCFCMFAALELGLTCFELHHWFMFTFQNVCSSTGSQMMRWLLHYRGCFIFVLIHVGFASPPFMSHHVNFVRLIRNFFGVKTHSLLCPFVHHSSHLWLRIHCVKFCQMSQCLWHFCFKPLQCLPSNHLSF